MRGGSRSMTPLPETVICRAPACTILMRAPNGKKTAESFGTVMVIAAALVHSRLDIVGERQAIAGAGLIGPARRHGISIATMSAMSFGENERSSVSLGSAISVGVTCGGSKRAAEV